MANSPRLVQWSVRIYEKLMLAYPAQFRKKFASEMTLVFRELASDAFQQYGVFGLFLAWFRILGDLLRTAPREHFAALQRRILMKTALRTVLWGILAAFIEIFVFGFFWIGFATYVFLVPGVKWHEIERYIYFMKFVGFILPPFLAGMILARTKPFFRPYVTAPLGIMMWWGLVFFLSNGPVYSPTASYTWECVAFYCAGIVGVAFLGLVTLLGCIAATKLSLRLEKPRTELSEKAEAI